MNFLSLRNSVFAFALASTFIAAAQTAVPAPTPAAAPIRVAVYEDEGSEKAATFFDETVGIDKAHFALTHVTAADIRNGVLKNYDVVIQGGGGSIAQAKSLQPAGRDAIREFDEYITAHYTGFRNADDYYFCSSASRIVDRIPIPTLVLHALDDPFIRLLPRTCDAMRDNPNVTLIETPHGGHCAFLGDADPAANDDGYWAEQTALRFLRVVLEL